MTKGIWLNSQQFILSATATNGGRMSKQTDNIDATKIRILKNLGGLRLEVHPLYKEMQEDILVLLAKIDVDAKEIAEYEKFLQQYKDALGDEEDDNERLEKRIAEGRGAFTKWLGECPTCGVQPNFGEEINHWDSCKYNEWLKAGE